MMKEGATTSVKVLCKYMKRIKGKGIRVVVYEPAVQDTTFFNSEIVSDLAEFKRVSDIIVANRITEDMADVSDKIFTRDLFNEN